MTAIPSNVCQVRLSTEAPFISLTAKAAQFADLSAISVSIHRRVKPRLGLTRALPYIERMSLRILSFLALATLPFGASAQDISFKPIPAAEVVEADLLYLKRPLVVFADSPNNPDFLRQMELLAKDPAALEERDVIVITDTTPDPPSDLRKKLRPRGFSLVILDKDLQPEIRKPLPWDVREITRAIDKFPSRRIEVLERNPAGR